MKYYERVCDENGCVIAVFDENQFIDIVIGNDELMKKYPDAVSKNFYDFMMEVSKE